MSQPTHLAKQDCTTNLSATRQELSEQSEGGFIFLTFIPRNEKARLAFHDLSQNKAKLHEHHARYIIVTGKERLGNTTSCDSRSERETTPESVLSADLVDPIIDVGYFGVSFGRPAVLKGGKWVLGRGSGKRFGPMRNVDLLLANPCDQKVTHGLAAAHALLKMHPASGAWLLQTGEERETSSSTSRGTEPPKLKATSMILDRETISDGDCRCLWKPSSTLEIAGLQFEIKFTIDCAEKEARYRKERDACLAEHNMPLPMSNITAIPHPKDVYIEWAVYRKGIGSGGNAAVFEGIDPLYGGLRAIKEITIKSPRETGHVQQEVDAHIALANIGGVVHLYGSTTSGMDVSLGFDGYPAKAYFVMERGISFNQYRWEGDQSVSWTLRMHLFKQLLEGLALVHQQGWMHRDITPQNILFFPSQKRAAFCDLGKAIAAGTHTDTNLANWYFLPPELEEGKNHRYDHQLDVWMLALALIHAWWKPAFRVQSSTKELRPRVPEEHCMIREKLEQDTTSGFADLLLGMLERDPHSRRNESQILKELSYRLSN